MEMLVITLIAVAAFAAVLVPLFRRGPRGEDEREFAAGSARTHSEGGLAPVAAGPASPVVDTTPHDGAAVAADEIEREVMRYRTAVRAGTVCRKCGQANPADSKFCFECGKPLARADAKEFE